MAEIISLNRVRKMKARTLARSIARENRIRYGRTRAEKVAAASEAAKLARAVEGAKRDLE